ncbi:MAG: monofunctional biosynthetic peptidoglycan transglycosylase [Betaproteobacteria bacterium]|nr:monofunctional biosynthetic peptidoglycan transglycosylase [Betaproteobacteria bacterium]
MRHLLWKLLKWCALACLVLAVAMTALVGSLNWRNPQSTAFMDAERERLSEAKPPKAITQVWVPYGRISLSAKRAVIAAEDSAFTQHDGVDWKAIELAMKTNAEKGKIKRGGSTITMQLAKNLYLSADRSYVRKGAELMITGLIELTLEKRRILEIYLNIAEWGVGIFGIEAAARHYFGVSAATLNDEQAAWLASILPAPKRADRRRDAPWIAQKAEVIQRRMLQVSVPR